MVVSKKLLVVLLCIGAMPFIYAQEAPDKGFDVGKAYAGLEGITRKNYQLADLYFTNVRSGALFVGGGLLELLGRQYKRPVGSYDFNKIYRIGFKTAARGSMAVGLCGLAYCHYSLQQIFSKKTGEITLSVPTEMYTD